jgi:hypothetical protein
MGGVAACDNGRSTRGMTGATRSTHCRPRAWAWLHACPCPVSSPVRYEQYENRTTHTGYQTRQRGLCIPHGRAPARCPGLPRWAEILRESAPMQHLVWTSTFMSCRLSRASVTTGHESSNARSSTDSGSRGCRDSAVCISIPLIVAILQYGGQLVGRGTRTCPGPRTQRCIGARPQSETTSHRGSACGL